MKKLLALGAVFVIFALPFVSFGADFGSGNEYKLRKSERVEGNFYAAGGSVTIEGNVVGDLIAVGGTVFSGGTVGGDILIAGGTVTILGPVDGDVRVAGGSVAIGGDVSGEVVAAGGTVTFLSSAKVAKGIAVGGGQVSLDGEVRGDVKAAGGEVTVNGTIRGSVSVEADEKVTLGPTAVIDGNLSYSSPRPAKFAPGTKVIGKTTYTEKGGRVDATIAKSGLAAALGAWFLVKLAATIAAALVLLWLARPWLQGALARAHDGFGREALRGFIMLVTIPIAAIVLFITVIGALPGAIALLLYFVLVILAKVMAGVLFGNIVYRAIRKSVPESVTWKIAVSGIVVLNVVSIIPFLGWAVSFIFFLAAFGAWGAWLYEAAKRIG